MAEPEPEPEPGSAAVRGLEPLSRAALSQSVSAPVSPRASAGELSAG